MILPVKPVPKSVWLAGDYPDETEYPVRRLTATCLDGWHDVIVGSAFRWSDENIQLSPTQDTSYEEWDRVRFKNRMSVGFKHKYRLFCKPCGKVTAHIPKGHT